MKYRMLTVDQLVGEYIDATRHEGELDETYLKKVLSDGAARINTFNQLTQHVGLFIVHDYKAEIPNNLKYIIQCACREHPDVCTPVEQVSKMTQDIVNSECELEISVKCPNCHCEPCCCENNKIVEVDVNRIWETANPQYMTSYMRHFYKHGGNTGRGYRSLYHPDFLLMQHASGNFWNVPYHINGCLNNRLECFYEYKIDFPYIIVNFKQGELLISYMANKLDKNGYHMLPDNVQAIKAVVYYAAERMAFGKYFQQPTATNERMWQNMMTMAERNIGRANNELRMWSEDKFWNFVQNHWRKLVPYRKFNQNMNRNKPDAFMLPEQTYNIDGYHG